MATYIMGDIHGCYQEYRALLEQIGFSLDDDLYVLGDAVDRGPEPIRVLLDLMERPNVFYIRGNHDEMLLRCMEKLAVEITDQSIARLRQEDLELYQVWINNGGRVTESQFREQPKEQQAAILEYLNESSTAETVEHDGVLYVMVHGGLGNFSPNKELEDYTPEELMWSRAHYYREYFPGKPVVLVTGHTPTPVIAGHKKAEVYQKNGHLALDCGCVFGGTLAAYCVETGQVFYQPCQFID